MLTFDSIVDSFDSMREKISKNHARTSVIQYKPHLCQITRVHGPVSGIITIWNFSNGETVLCDFAKQKLRVNAQHMARTRLTNGKAYDLVLKRRRSSNFSEACVPPAVYSFSQIIVTKYSCTARTSD